MADRELGIRLTADDEASEVIDGVAESVDQLNDDGATIEVEADTGPALSNVEKLDREVENLTDDGKELRIEFRAARLQQQIRSSLRELERLEDPIEIEAETKNLERLQGELRELEKLASEKYEIQIDADPKRNVQRASNDIEGMRQKGEGLQSAIPAIRGFGDELGGTAQASGIASQAIADLGDFALISGERFAQAGGKMSGIATKLGTVLGAAGLAGAFAGIAVQLGSSLLPKLQEFINGSEDATYTQEELAAAIDGVAEALASRSFDAAVDTWTSNNREMIDSANELGISTEDLLANVFSLDDGLLDAEGIIFNAEKHEELREKIKAQRIEVNRATDASYKEGLAADSTARQLEAKSDAEREGTTAARDSAEANEEAARSQREYAQAVEDAVRGRQSLISANDAALRSQGALNEAAAATNAAFAEFGEGSEQAAISTIALASSFDAQAQAAVRLAEQQAEANGTQFTAADSAKVYADNLFALVATLDGPAKAALLGYIDTLDGVPDNLSTQLGVEVEVAQGEIAEVTDGDYEAEAGLGADTSDAEGDIAEVEDGDYSATVELEALTTTAQAQIDELTKPRTVDVTLNLTNIATARGQISSLEQRSARAIRNLLGAYDQVNGGRGLGG